MPGILGIIAKGQQESCERQLDVMLAAMNRKGSYTLGSCVYPDSGVYLGWLAHPGSEAARESYSERRDGSRLVIAGEWHASVDAVAAYQKEGISFVARLNGLFAGALVDPARNRLVLFNDRYGSERIYYFERPGMVLFASEAKALLSVLPECRVLDDAGVADFLAFGSVGGGRTLFRGIELLPGGSFWEFERGESRGPRRYFVPSEWEEQEPLESLAEFSARFGETFREALPRYFPPAESVGISITGGLDTRMIMACRSRASRAVCYTYAADQGEALDVRIGRRAAEASGLEHQVLRLEPEFLAQFGKHLDDTVWVSDGCAGAIAAHELPLSCRARELAPIRLTGNYGGEVLRGVSTFKPLGLVKNLIHCDFRVPIEKSIAERVVSHPVTHGAFEEAPYHLFGTWAVARSVLTLRTPYLDNELVRLAYRVPANARRSIQPAIDLINRFDPALARIPTDRGLTPAKPKGVVSPRRIFEEVAFKLDYLHKEALPGWMSGLEPAFRGLSRMGLLGRHKFLSYRRWFERELASYIREVLTDPGTMRMPYWDADGLKTLLADHDAGRRNCATEIHVVLTLEAVQRVLVDAWGVAQGSRSGRDLTAKASAA